jgi:6-phosphogluconate dehydrogenase
MVPAGLVDQEITALAPLLSRDDVIIDGGNSHFKDDVRRARELKAQGIHYLDVGTSGGVWGLERGYCLMIGGERAIADRLDPIFQTLAPGQAAATPTPGRSGAGTAERGYLYCGQSGAGHFVKMVHNGIEYGVMAAYAEGLNILRHANAGALSLRLRHRRHRRGLAAGKRRALVAARSRGPGAGEGRTPREIRRARLGLRRRTLDDRSRD